MVSEVSGTQQIWSGVSNNVIALISVTRSRVRSGFWIRDKLRFRESGKGSFTRDSGRSRNLES